MLFSQSRFLLDEEKAAQQTTLTQTQFAQPSIGALSMGMYKTMVNAGFKADFMAGHSFGELTALWAGGVISDDHFVFLGERHVARRWLSKRVKQILEVC